MHYASTTGPLDFLGFVKSMYYILLTSFAVIQQMPIRLCLYQITHFAISLASDIGGKALEMLLCSLNSCAGVCKRMNARVAFRKDSQL